MDCCGSRMRKHLPIQMMKCIPKVIPWRSRQRKTQSKWKVMLCTVFPGLYCTNHYDKAIDNSYVSMIKRARSAPLSVDPAREVLR